MKQKAYRWRFLNTLRGRISGVTVIIVLLLLVGSVLIGVQLIRIRRAIMEIQTSTRYLEAALVAAQQAAELVASVQQGVTSESDPDQFVRRIAPTLLALELQRNRLRVEAQELPPGSALRARMSTVAMVLGNLTAVARQVIRSVDEGDYDLAKYLVAQLVVNYQLVEQESEGLLLIARSRHEQAEAEARVSIQRIALIVPVISALLLFAIVGLAWVGLRGIITGMGLLSRSAQQLAEGRLEERVPVRGLEEFRLLAQTFNSMAAELQQMYTGLERLVAQRTAELARRTAQLEAASQVARRAAEIRDLDTLLNETVRLISDRFGFYHAGIFLVDDLKEYAVLRAASSEGGQRMLARGHKLAVGRVGIVGYVAGTGRPRIALDVGADAVFFDNPDLPLTRSEMALPLKIGEEVIGVLDVQSVEPEAFTEEDIAVLQTLADQVALAIQNARLLEESEQRLRELEAVYGERARRAWQEVTTRRSPGYRYTRVEVEPLPGPMTAPAELTDGHQLTIPLRLWGQTVGTITLRRDPDMPPWTAEERRLAEDLGDQISLALESARLMEETRRHAERDRLIAEITARVRASMDPETILRTAARELGTALGVDRVLVQFRTAPASIGSAPATEEKR